MKCPKCGAPMEGNTCSYCGYIQQASASATAPNAAGGKTAAAVVTQVFINTQSTTAQANISPKSRWLALAICYFLGLFGGHYFYVGKAGKGILYLFTAGLFGFGWIVDMIRIATGKFVDANNLPLKK